ncbi:hypothetical protein BDA96_03G195100 [Sorghum bicolor]|uniref:Mitochondrial import inner membrane translocase subunit TIM50 n=1 Tax=Sorghum bicolor TaxID=4558 RepID=A0A921UQG5_SORBI|nr:hypothetical protein BDA96_03G195100 [Sorghum bicolor]
MRYTGPLSLVKKIPISLIRCPTTPSPEAPTVLSPGVPAPPLLLDSPSSSAAAAAFAEPRGPRAVRGTPTVAVTGEADAVPGCGRDAHPLPDGPTAVAVRLHRAPVIGGHAVTFYVVKRPGVEAFLCAAAEIFEVVVFTAGLQEYASLVLDRLDPDREVFAHRLYRGACRDADDGRLVKDLAATGRRWTALSSSTTIPMRTLCSRRTPSVAPFVDDDNDQELQRVMAFLDVAAGTKTPGGHQILQGSRHGELSRCPATREAMIPS